MARQRNRRAGPDPHTLAFAQALEEVSRHPLTGPLATRARVRRDDDARRVVGDGWARVDTRGVIYAHPDRHGSVEQWRWVIAHLLLHLGLGHLDPDRAEADGYPKPWAVAADVTVNRLLEPLKLGSSPVQLAGALPGGSEQTLAARFALQGIPPELDGNGPGGSSGCLHAVKASEWDRRADWEGRLGQGLAAAVTAAIEVAGGDRTSLTDRRARRTVWRQALDWFVSSYPLLGAVAAELTLVEDAEVCRTHAIDIAAVAPADGELYVNPHAGLSVDECRFVIAHELLHAGLRHDRRTGGRDPVLYNVACDLVINGWLVEMGVGTMPDGLLYDPQLAGLSAEQVYDRITTDLRRARKLATLRGAGAGDVLGHGLPHPGEAAGAVGLDEFYRRALAQGLELHRLRPGRGLLPAGLVEEIQALDHPPIPWDVELARWFDEQFPALEPRRTYARLSRRSSATPDIPRPSRYLPPEEVTRRTFGVVLDTSGSMGAKLLGTALGAVASYAAARDVTAVRVVFCDAAAYDAGYLDVGELANRVRVSGRGGTRLQPGVDLLLAAEDLPDGAPLLVITDGACDVVQIPARRASAWLVPAGARLPFTPRGEVFRFE